MRWLLGWLRGERCQAARVFRYMEAVHCGRCRGHPGAHHYIWRSE